MRCPESVLETTGIGKLKFFAMPIEPMNPLLKVAAPAGSSGVRIQGAALLARVIVHDSKFKRDNHSLLVLQPIFLLCYASRGAEEDVCTD